MNKTFLFKAAASFFLFILLDSIWFHFSGDFFLTQMRPLVTVDEAGMVVDLKSAIVVYILMTLGMLYFVSTKSFTGLWGALIAGAIYGLVVYGVYDFTNHATLKAWPLSLMVVDISWGGFSCALVSGALYKIGQQKR